MSDLKKILNRPEEDTYQVLLPACGDWGARVYPKVRLADVLPIEGSGIPDDSFSYALKSHFDFLAVDEKNLPLFAIEFDGPLHEEATQAARDSLKDALCDRFELPLLRINSRYLEKKYRDLDLLSWFVQVWFLRKGFYEAQEKGAVPYDEDFDPFMFFSLPGYKQRFPLWISAPSNIAIQKLAKAGKLLSPAPSLIVSRDLRGRYRALGYVFVDRAFAVCCETGMKTQRFDVSESEILSEIVICELYEGIKAWLLGKGSLMEAAQVDSLIGRYEKEYTLLRAATCGTRGRS